MLHDANRVGSLAFNSDGTVLAAAFDGEPKGQPLPVSAMSYFALAPDEGVVALVEDYRARTIIYDVAKHESIAMLKSPSARIEAHYLAFRPDGSRLAIGHSDGVVRLFDTGTWKLALELPDHDSRVLDTDARSIAALAWSPDGRWLAVGNGLRGAPGTISVYAADDLGG